MNTNVTYKSSNIYENGNIQYATSDITYKLCINMTSKLKKTKITVLNDFLCKNLCVSPVLHEEGNYTFEVASEAFCREALLP